MRHLSEIPANWGTVRALTATADWSIDPEWVAYAKTPLPEAQFSGKTSFCFLLSDEKLLGRFGVLIRIAAALRRFVITTL